MNSPLSKPSTTMAGVKDFDGKDIVVVCREFIPGVVTRYGPKDAVSCDVLDVETGTFHQRVRFFGGMLVGSFSRSMNEPVLTSIRKASEAKEGQQPAWIPTEVKGPRRNARAEKAWSDHLARGKGALTTPESLDDDNIEGIEDIEDDDI